MESKQEAMPTTTTMTALIVQVILNTLETFLTAHLSKQQQLTPSSTATHNSTIVGNFLSARQFHSFYYHHPLVSETNAEYTN